MNLRGGGRQQGASPCDVIATHINPLAVKLYNLMKLLGGSAWNSPPGMKHGCMIVNVGSVRFKSFDVSHAFPYL